MDAPWTLSCGDALEWVKSLPEEPDLILYSPPYERARLYLEDGKNLGIARKTEAWVSWQAKIITACVRKCKGLVACVCEGQTKQFRCYELLAERLAAIANQALGEPNQRTEP